MPGRVHQNDAPALSLASSLAAGATTIPVNQSITGVETPISYTINSGGANQEIVTLVDKNTSTTPSQFENCVRGCDGTADQSHSSGEVLMHEATARDFVDSDFAYSEMGSPGRLEVAESFRGKSGNIAGQRAPTGQVWETRNVASADVTNEKLTIETDSNNEAMALLPVSNTNLFVEATIGHNKAASNPKSHIVFYQDANNWLAVGQGRGNSRINSFYTKKVAGSVSQSKNEISTSGGKIPIFKIEAVLAQKGGFSSQVYIYRGGSSVISGDANSNEVNDIRQGVSKVGIYTGEQFCTLYNLKVRAI